MKNILASVAMLVLFRVPVFGGAVDIAAEDCSFNVGVGRVDVTPPEEVALAGAPVSTKTSTVDTPLYVKAMVLSSGSQRAVIVTLDVLKYPTNLADQARKQIEAKTGIPASNIILCASHTHSGPMWTYYKGQLIPAIKEAAALAVADLTPCKLGISKGRVDGVNRNRRVIKDGSAWNIWFLKGAERDRYPAAGPRDPGVSILAAVDGNGKYKAILYNYGCHPDDTRDDLISADYPGHVQRVIEERLGYDVPTLFLLGPCGDINPSRNDWSHVFGEKVASEILKILGDMEFIRTPMLKVESRELSMPGREDPKFAKEDISTKWPTQLEHYRKAFTAMKRSEKPVYKTVLTGIRVGDDFAIISNPVEMFCETGLDIKKDSPFKMTMIATLTSGACGYIPTLKGFEEGGYETWYGEHSFLTVHAAEIIQKESLNILKQLKNEE